MSDLLMSDIGASNQASDINNSNIKLAAQFTIELKGLRFFAEHGLYEEEAKLGNEFEVDISIDYKAPQEVISSIDQTVNYVEIFRIVRDEFSQRKNLLETCAMQIANTLQEQFTQIERLTISIRKLNPPITNFTGTVGVIYTASAVPPKVG
jgi:dihydroneopterin aldolase